MLMSKKSVFIGFDSGLVKSGFKSGVGSRSGVLFGKIGDWVGGRTVPRFGASEISEEKKSMIDVFEATGAGSDTVSKSNDGASDVISVRKGLDKAGDPLTAVSVAACTEITTRNYSKYEEKYSVLLTFTR